MKHLYLLRHAKSSWAEEGIDDHDRPLAGRGKKDAQRLEEYLRQAHIAPALVLCSSARRTRETLKGIQPALPKTTKVAIEDGLYLASARDVIKRLRDVADGVASVMVIGHNPTLQELALALATRGAPLARLRENLPTGSLVSIALPEGPWSKVGKEEGELTSMITPSDLK